MTARAPWPSLPVFTLGQHDENYSKTEPAALSTVLGVAKFRLYSLRGNFSLITDHKPLVTIFGHNKQLPSIASARMHRWPPTLSASMYVINRQSRLFDATKSLRSPKLVVCVTFSARDCPSLRPITIERERGRQVFTLT